MLTIDGAYGEGGGQILRTALALSLCESTAVRIINIRVKRAKPGLAWQHLAAVNAAAKVGNAEVQGAAHRSTELTFLPKRVQGGQYAFDIGTAGSTSLVLQTLLPALMLADLPSEIFLSGGTHNPLAPSFDFLQRAFFPLLNKMGVQIQAQLIRPGFFPKGAGQIKITIKPCKKLQPLQLEQRGKLLQKMAVARLAGLPLHIAERELHTLQQHLQLAHHEMHVEALSSEYGPGNVVFVELQSEHITELFTGYGERRVRAETVASRLAREVQAYLQACVPVGHYLADQLLLPFALAGRGSFITQQPSSHALTNIHVIKQFMDIHFHIEQLNPAAFRIQMIPGQQ